MADVVVDPECQNPKELYGQGVRAFILQDFDAAVSALSKVSELLVEKYKDDLHEELGDVYLYYGKALLGLARDQNEALGDAVPKNEDSDDDEDVCDEEKAETEDKTEADTSQEEKSAQPIPEEESEQNGEQATCSSTTNGSGENNEAGPSKANGDSTNEQNGDEDPSDLQVAWEVLELAKKIFDKQGDKKNLAETMIVLGEISLESENFESAIKDIEQGLNVQKEVFAKDSRSVAETYYKLGMAYSTSSQIDEAVASFNSSLEYLRNRIKTLEEVKLATEEHKDEIEEIKNLMPDIEDKIADMKLYKEEAIAKINEAVKEPVKETVDSAGSSKQATDISHLVKRKRKLEPDSDKDADVPAKKAA